MAENDIASYRVAADFLNGNKIDVVSVQHEYGIFGGKGGNYLLTLLRKLRMPIVTTVHTILGKPDSMQRRAMNEFARLSRRLVVMSAHAAAYGRSMLWSAVARRYLESFDRASSREQSSPRVSRELPARSPRVST